MGRCSDSNGARVGFQTLLKGVRILRPVPSLIKT